MTFNPPFLPDEEINSSTYYQMCNEQQEQMKLRDQEYLSLDPASLTADHPIYTHVFHFTLPSEQAYRVLDSSKYLKS
jgi:hypothetical protein